MKRVVVLLLVTLGVAGISVAENVSVPELPSQIITEVTLEDPTGDTADVWVLHIQLLSDHRGVVVADVIATIEEVAKVMALYPQLSVAELQKMARKYLVEKRGWPRSFAEAMIFGLSAIADPFAGLPITR